MVISQWMVISQQCSTKEHEGQTNGLLLDARSQKFSLCTPTHHRWSPFWQVPSHRRASWPFNILFASRITSQHIRQVSTSSELCSSSVSTRTRVAACGLAFPLRPQASSLVVCLCHVKWLTSNYTKVCLCFVSYEVSHLTRHKHTYPTNILTPKLQTNLMGSYWCKKNVVFKKSMILLWRHESTYLAASCKRCANHSAMKSDGGIVGSQWKALLCHHQADSMLYDGDLGNFLRTRPVSHVVIQ